MPGCGLYTFLESQFSNDNFGSTIAEIKLRLSYPNNRIVIVEGFSDYIVLSNLFDSKIHVLQPYCKGNAEKIMGQIDYSHKNIIAILDRDYDPLSSDDRIFYYDFCNLEMMLVHNDELFENFCNGAVSSKSAIEYRDFVLKQLKPLSALRLFNSMSKTTGCKEFSALKAVGTLSNCLLLPNDCLIWYIRNYFVSNVSNPNLCPKEVRKIITEFGKQLSSLLSRDAYTFTNGHDFNDLFVRLLPNSLCISPTCAGNSIYNYYKAGFVQKVFQKTSLYTSIKQHETITGERFLSS